MDFRARYQGTLDFLIPLLIGCWIGLKILPGLPFLSQTQPTVEENVRLQALRSDLEKKLEETLKLSPNVLDARIHLAKGTASVTLQLSKTDVSSDQIESVANQVAAGVDGLHTGQVSIFSSDGTQLNRQSIESYNRRQWWKDLALTVGKVLGILAALITLRYIIQSVGAFEKHKEGIKTT